MKSIGTCGESSRHAYSASQRPARPRAARGARRRRGCPPGRASAATRRRPWAAGDGSARRAARRRGTPTPRPGRRSPAPARARAAAAARRRSRRSSRRDSPVAITWAAWCRSSFHCAVAPARRRQQGRLVGVVLQHEVHVPRRARARRAAARAISVDDVLGRVVTHRVHGIEPQAVEVVLLDPVERVVDEEVAHGAAVDEVDAGAPRRVAGGV